jgi:hypothetical protein
MEAGEEPSIPGKTYAGGELCTLLGGMALEIGSWVWISDEKVVLLKLLTQHSLLGICAPSTSALTHTKSWKIPFN